jgi:hypothetical protein
MAFDWKDFAAVFLEKTAENIERRGEEARTYREEEKQAAKRNAELINERAARAKQAASYARKAKAYLGSHPQADLMVKAAISDGPAGIQDLYQKLEAAANQPGQNGMLGQADIDTLINMPELPPIEQKYIDMGLESFAMQTYGASKDALIRPAEEQGEVGLVGQLFGFGAKQRVDEQLSKQQYGMGMSISDINDLAEQAEYQNIIKDTSLTYGTLDRFDLDDYTKFDAIITKAIKDAMDANETALNAANDRLLNDAERDKFKTGIQRSAAEPLIAESVRENPRMLQSPSVAQRIVAVMGQDYLDKLYVEYGVFTEEELKEMRGEGGSDRTTDAEAAAAKEAAATKAAAAEIPQPPEVEAGNIPPRPIPTNSTELNADVDDDVVDWDRKYAGKYDPVTRQPIIVPIRPPIDSFREERKLNGRIEKISRYNEWNEEHGDTHNPKTGRPLPVEE